MDYFKKYMSKRSYTDYRQDIIALLNYPSALMIMGVDRALRPYLFIYHKKGGVKHPGHKACTVDMQYGDKMTICIYESDNFEEFADAFAKTLSADLDCPIVHDNTGFQILKGRRIKPKDESLGLLRTKKTPGILKIMQFDRTTDTDEEDDAMQAIDLLIVSESEQKVEIQSRVHDMRSIRFEIRSISDASVMTDFIGMLKDLGVTTPGSSDEYKDEPYDSDGDDDVESYKAWKWARLFLGIISGYTCKVYGGKMERNVYYHYPRKYSNPSVYGVPLWYQDD